MAQNPGPPRHSRPTVPFAVPGAVSPSPIRGRGYRIGGSPANSAAVRPVPGKANTARHNANKKEKVDGTVDYLTSFWIKLVLMVLALLTTIANWSAVTALLLIALIAFHAWGLFGPSKPKRRTFTSDGSPRVK